MKSSSGSAERSIKREMDRLITIPEVAEITGYSQGVVGQLFAAGLIPCLKNGRVRKCQRMAVDIMPYQKPVKNIRHN